MVRLGGLQALLGICSSKLDQVSEYLYLGSSVSSVDTSLLYAGNSGRSEGASSGWDGVLRLPPRQVTAAVVA